MTRSCSKFQDHRILLHRSRNSPCPATPESQPKADSRWKNALSVALRVHRFSVVELYPLPHNKFFVILPLLGSSLYDPPEKLCFSFLLLHIAGSFPFVSDQSIDLPDEVPSSGIGAACQFHKEQYQHFAFSILLSPTQTAL